jgi:hypothetical protein
MSKCPIENAVQEVLRESSELEMLKDDEEIKMCEAQ